MKQAAKNKILKDLAFIVFSLIIGLVILKTDAARHLLLRSVGLEYVGIFIAGIFFTSVFTTIPATIILGEMALSTNLWTLALVGGLGALIGDFIIFGFFKYSVTEDLKFLLTLSKSKRLKHIFKSKVFKVFLTLLGGLIIASPLPDELGLALMGVSQTDNRAFTIISFVCNTLGIALVGLIAKAIA